MSPQFHEWAILALEFILCRGQTVFVSHVCANLREKCWVSQIERNVHSRFSGNQVHPPPSGALNGGLNGESFDPESPLLPLAKVA